MSAVQCPLLLCQIASIFDLLSPDPRFVRNLDNESGSYLPKQSQESRKSLPPSGARVKFRLTSTGGVCYILSVVNTLLIRKPGLLKG